MKAGNAFLPFLIFVFLFLQLKRTGSPTHGPHAQPGIPSHTLPCTRTGHDDFALAALSLSPRLANLKPALQAECRHPNEEHLRPHKLRAPSSWFPLPPKALATAQSPHSGPRAGAACAWLRPGARPSPRSPRAAANAPSQ